MIVTQSNKITVTEFPHSLESKITMLKTTFLLVSAIGILGALQACSVPYDILQEDAAQACKKIVDWNDRSACLNKNKMSYEQYEKQRKEMLNKGSGK